MKKKEWKRSEIKQMFKIKTCKKPRFLNTQIQFKSDGKLTQKYQLTAAGKNAVERLERQKKT